MKVLVMTALGEISGSLQIVMAARINGVEKVSPVMVKLGIADSRNGNPYLVYGDAVEDFIGSSKYDASIVVFNLRSGDLSGFGEPEEPAQPVSLSIAALRRKLPVGSTYSGTWIGPPCGTPQTTRRRVVSQSARLMQSIILDGPESGRTMRLEWKGVSASESIDGVTLSAQERITRTRADYVPFLKIDTIGN